MQAIIIAPDSKFNMYWIIPGSVSQAFTHDFYHIEVSATHLSLTAYSRMRLTC